ncbi:MAG: hypothetical protein JWN70_3422 [Planctomycetaceae bacterium]|nr:hypothetical protein [Planctomycetaceae bacterium]
MEVKRKSRSWCLRVAAKVTVFVASGFLATFLPHICSAAIAPWNAFHAANPLGEAYLSCPAIVQKLFDWCFEDI